MPRHRTAPRPLTRIAAAGLGVLLLGLAAGAGGEAEVKDQGKAGAAEADAVNPTLDLLVRQANRAGRVARGWYFRTPPADRVTWGGLIAAAGLGLLVLTERSWRLRRRRVVPPSFVGKFRGRLADGKLDRTKALDFCELNPSPAARVALAAIGRWGRPAADLERAVTLAKTREVDRLRRNVGTLRRIAALSPLIGLLGTLMAAGRALAGLGADGASGAWGPALATALAPLTAGVGLAILALVAYDGLAGKVEALAGDLDRLGAETVDAIAMAAVADSIRLPSRVDSPSLPRAPHQFRINTHSSVEPEDAEL